jgi:hypothetical protein
LYLEADHYHLDHRSNVEMEVVSLNFFLPSKEEKKGRKASAAEIGAQ